MELDLRGTMRNYATGVCVVTTYVDVEQERRHDALTVNSLTTISTEPPLASICLRRGSRFLADLLTSGVWAVSILDAAGVDIARSFARDRASRAVALQVSSAAPGPRTGALVLDSPGWFECALLEHRDAGDHTVLVGRVVAAGGTRRRPALVFLHGAYHALAD
jgi:flavin reductase (DIM6/NTAB) family NADH-FMN oxidoreductase RutF